MGVTLQTDTVLRTLGNVHIVKYLLKVIQYFRMILHQFGKAKAVTLACSFLTPN